MKTTVVVCLLLALAVSHAAETSDQQPLSTSSDKPFEVPEGKFTTVAYSSDHPSAKKCSCTQFEVTKNKENNSIQMKGFCLKDDKTLYTFEKVATPVKDKVNQYTVEKVKAQIDGKDVMKKDEESEKKSIVWSILNAGADHFVVQNTENKNVFVLARTEKIPELKAHMDKLPALASQFGIKDLKVVDTTTSCKELDSKMKDSTSKLTEPSKESSSASSGMADEGDDGMAEEGRERREKIRKHLDILSPQRLFLVASAEQAFQTCKCPTLDLKLRHRRVKTVKAVDFRFNCMNATTNEVVTILGEVRKDDKSGKHVAKATKKMINGKEVELSENEKKDYVAEHSTDLMLLHSDKITSFGFLNDTKASIFSTGKNLEDHQRKIFDTVFNSQNIKLNWIVHDAAVCDAVYPKMDSKKKSLRETIRERKERLRKSKRDQLRDEDTDTDTDDDDDDDDFRRSRSRNISS